MRLAVSAAVDVGPGDGDFDPRGFALPMTMMVVDQRNEAMRVTIEVSGRKTWH
jgi:hypothetical protein